MRKEFEEKFCKRYGNLTLVDSHFYNRADEIWDWIEEKIREVKINENKYWLKNLRELGLTLVDRDDFNDRIKELKQQIFSLDRRAEK